MNKNKTRTDDYLERRNHLENCTDEELKQKFWALADKATEPLIELAYTHTSPAIERSVLLRMGFSSIEAQALVKKVMSHELMPKGAGHVVYRYAKLRNIAIREAGESLLNDIGWDEVMQSFGVSL